MLCTPCGDELAVCLRQQAYGKRSGKNLLPDCDECSEAGEARIIARAESLVCRRTCLLSCCSPLQRSLPGWLSSLCLLFLANTQGNPGGTGS